MPRRRTSKPDMLSRKRQLTWSGVPQEEWPEDLARYWNRIEKIEDGWIKQLKALSASQLRILAHAALVSTSSLEREVEALRSEIEKRDQLRTKRGKAAQLPGVAEFKDWVKREWDVARTVKKPGATAGFARRVIARKGAPITDPRTVLRWCREWETERRLAANPPLVLNHMSERPRHDVFYQVSLLRDAVCDPGTFDDWDGV